MIIISIQVASSRNACVHQVAKEFHDLIQKKVITYDVKGAFDKSENTISVGPKMVLKSVEGYPSSSPNTIVNIKKILVESEEEEDKLVTEIEFNEMMNESPNSQKYFGCVFEYKSVLGFLPGYSAKYIYLIQSSLDVPIKNSAKLKQLIVKLSSQQMLTLYIDIISGLMYLWAIGYAHNKLTPDVLLINHDLRAFPLSSYEFATEKDSRRIDEALTFYSSPSSFLQPPPPLKPKDDLYSLALTILYLENKLDETTFDNSHHTARFVHDAEQDKTFQECMIEKAKEILKENYGECVWPLPRDLVDVNFTTLIVAILQYQDFKLNFDRIISIIQTQIPKVSTDPRDAKKRVLFGEDNGLEEIGLKTSEKSFKLLSVGSGSSINAKVNPERFFRGSMEKI